ncbi:hypothetical protein [Mucilaginibacter defluvii]|uniref:Uncharacterized protein n=1 Tax=Mucilaginibacter defluvii TaxID=1196019 RepID=A0ABP9G5T5_9SPHI
MEIARLSIIAYYTYRFNFNVSHDNFYAFAKRVGMDNFIHISLVAAFKKPVVLTTFLTLGIFIVHKKALDYKTEFLFGLLLAYLLTF